MRILWSVLGLGLMSVGLTATVRADDLPTVDRGPIASSPIGLADGTPRARSEAFLSRSSFRPFLRVGKSGEVVTTLGVSAGRVWVVEFRFDPEDAEATERVARQFHGLELASRFARTAEEAARVRSACRDFERLWCGATPNSGERGARLEDALRSLLSDCAPRIRRRAREELAAVIGLRRGEGRREFRRLTGEFHESLLRERSALRTQAQHALQQMGDVARERTSSFYSSTFDDLEGPYLECQRGARPDAPFETLRDRLTSAEDSVDKIRGDTLFELLRSAGVPRESLEGARERADRRCEQAFEVAEEELRTFETQAEELLSQRHAGYAGDLAGLLVPASGHETNVDEYLTLVDRVRRILENANTSLETELASLWADQPRAIRTRLDTDLGSVRRAFLTNQREEVRAYQEVAETIVDGATRQIATVEADAQKDFRAFGRDFAFADARQWSSKPLDGVESASLHRQVGYALASDLRLSFAERWLDQRGEELDQQFRFLALAYRFVGDDRVDEASLRRAVQEFNTMWTRSEIDRGTFGRFDRELRLLLTKLTPTLREATRVGLRSVAIENEIVWRRTLARERADLRAAAGRRTDEVLAGSPNRAVRIHEVIAQACAILGGARERSLGTLEREYFDRTGFRRLPGSAPDPADDEALEQARRKICALYDGAIAEFRLRGRDLVDEARLELESATSQTHRALQEAESEIDALDVRVVGEWQQELDRRVAFLDDLWDQEGHRSLYQFGELIESLRRVYAEFGRAVDPRTARRHLEVIAKPHLAKLARRSSEMEEDSTRPLEQELSGRSAELEVEARHLVQDFCIALDRE
ncbi:MAG: hypothetical protein KDC38_08070 [Planctomycetes bacterium]|nr:hypothetical protein [Planctomycetota bacterium]